MTKQLIASVTAILAFVLVLYAPAAGRAGDAYSLHVGSYSSGEAAAEQVSALKKKGHDAFSVKPEGKNGRWRVFIGRYAGADEAAREGSNLERKKEIRFFAVRNIASQEPIQDDAGKKNGSKAVKSSPAPDALAAALRADRSPHPQIVITSSAPTAPARRGKAPLHSVSEKPSVAPSGNPLTEGIPQPEPLKFKPFDKPRSSDVTSGTGGRDASVAEDEALYLESVALYRKGQYIKAVDKFRSYIDQFAGSPRSKASFFWIAECYSQLQDTTKSDLAFQEALKRWPDYQDIPREILISLGFHFFRQGSHDHVVGVFSYYINIYPDDPFRKEMSYLIARSLTEMQQYEPALKVFSTVVERYPDSKEATESSIIMANIGVKNPRIKLPVYMAGRQYYKDPIATYDAALSKNLPSAEMVERILFQKAHALHQEKRFQDAFRTSIDQLKRYPSGKCKDAGQTLLKAITERLVDEDYRNADYVRVADNYYTAYEGAWVKSIDFSTGYRIADSLRRLGLYRDARRVADHLLLVEKDTRHRNSMLVMLADVNVRERQYDEAERIVTDLSKGTASLEREDRMALHRIQGDLYLKKGLYQKAAAAYADVSVDGMGDAAALHRNYGTALRFSDACPSAIRQFQLAIRQSEKNKDANNQVMQDALAGVGDCYLNARKYTEAVSAYRQAVDSAKSGAQNPWTLYHLGKGYVEMDNSPEANRVFSELKVKTGDDFWNKAIDYTLFDAAWTQKYRKYLSTK